MTVNPGTLTAARKLECELDGLYFARYFMKQRLGAKMDIGPHHRVMQSTLERTTLPPGHPDGISRLIINVPPGYTKTELAVIHYMSRGLAIDPRNRFLHLSYSDDLALINSSTTRGVVRSRAYQDMWPVETMDDTDSKKTWWTKQSGGIRAASAGGQVTGFRAGHMDKTQFTGAMLFDDPLKPGDARSPVKRKALTDTYCDTAKSRLALESVPIIIVMQRLHYDDLCGFLLRGGSGEVWHHLNLPALLDSADVYPEENTHGRPVQHGLPDGWLWPFKHNDEHETALRAARTTWNSQYMQRPPRRDSDDILWTQGDIDQAHTGAFNTPQRTVIAVDPAATNTKTSDEHGILAATRHGMNQYTIDRDYTRKGTPKQWATTAIRAHRDLQADAIVIETNQGGDMCEDTLRNAGFTGRIIRVHASKGKVTRSEPIAALYAQGFVKHKPGLVKTEEEMLDFNPGTGLSLGKSPNRVDAAVWALTELSKRGKFRVS